MTWLILLGYIVLGIYLARTRPVNDVERSMLDLDHAEMADRYAREFGGMIPRRMPFRLPLEYWLWAWTQDLFVARLVGLGIGGIGLYITMVWGGPIAGLVVLSSPMLVGALTSASFVPYTATLWIGGLYGIHTEHAWISSACGAILAFLRPTSWGMALWLFWASGGIVLASGLAACLWMLYPQVVQSQGWWRLLGRQTCPVQALPQDGWWYGLKTLFKRYESWGLWFTVAGISGHWDEKGIWLIGMTGCLFMLTHFPRMLIRPKWAVGYVSEWLLPVAVAIGLFLSR